GLVGVVGFAERRRGGRRAGGRVRLRGEHRHVGRCNVEGPPARAVRAEVLREGPGWGRQLRSRLLRAPDVCGVQLHAVQRCGAHEHRHVRRHVRLRDASDADGDTGGASAAGASGPHAAAVRAGLHACVADGPHGAAAAGPRVRQERPEQAQLQVDAPRRRDPWRGVHVVVHHVVPTRPCGPPASEGGPVCAGECLRAGTLAPGASSPLLGGARVHAIARRPNHHASAKQGPLSLPLQSASAAAQPGCAELHVGVCQLCPAAGVAAAWPSRSASDSPTAPLLPAALQLCST
ncbi:unnamed protein product, partial [Prorocentrum cordatum]